ncbi:hypothetical protein FNF31_02266 [Cafeteria roenbergensis]|uniref:6-phosphogluconolactonase n=1 Tax=Cafeteria roenbergensis TaxID=33653 RepID=A0A5A8DI13_CAFRO|nr:hypothetical protein FNF31_02266 [Cafeteria roenbergensis]
MDDLDDIFGSGAAPGPAPGGHAASASSAVDDEFAPKSALDSALDDLAPRAAPAPGAASRAGHSASASVPAGAAHSPASGAGSHSASASAGSEPADLLPDNDPLPTTVRGWPLKLVRAYLKKKRVDVRGCVEKSDFVELAVQTAAKGLARDGIRTGTRMGAEVTRGPGAMDKLDAWEVTGFGADKPRESEHVKQLAAARSGAAAADLAAYEGLRKGARVARMPVPLSPSPRLCRLLPAGAAAPSVREVGLQFVRDCWTALTPTQADMATRATGLLFTAAVRASTEDTAAAAAVAKAAEGWRRDAASRGALRTAAGLLPYRSRTVVGPKRAWEVPLRPETPPLAVVRALRQAAAAQSLAVTAEAWAGADAGANAARAVLVMQQRVLVPSGTWSEMQRRFEAVGQTAELAAKASQAGGASKADPKAEAALRLARSWADALPPGDDLPVQVPAVTPIPGGGAGSGRQDEAPAPLGVVSDSQAEAREAADRAEAEAAPRSWTFTTYVNSVTALLGVDPAGRPVALLVTARYLLPSDAKEDDPATERSFGPLLRKSRPGGRVLGAPGSGAGGGDDVYGAAGDSSSDLSAAAGIAFAAVPPLPGFSLRRAGPVPQHVAAPKGGDEAAWPVVDAAGVTSLGGLGLPAWTAVRACLARPVPVDVSGRPQLDAASWAADGFPSAVSLRAGATGRPLVRVDDETAQLAIALVASARAPVRLTAAELSGAADASASEAAAAAQPGAAAAAAAAGADRCVLAEGAWRDAVSSSKADLASSRGEEPAPEDAAVAATPLLEPSAAARAAIREAVERGGADRVLRRVACADAAARRDEWIATQLRRLLLPAFKGAGVAAPASTQAPALASLPEMDLDDEIAVIEAQRSAPDARAAAAAADRASAAPGAAMVMPVVEAALDAADGQADAAATASEALLRKLESAERGTDVTSAADLGAASTGEAARARAASGASAPAGDEPGGLTVTEELAADVYARALTKARISGASLACTVARELRRWAREERSQLAARLRHCALRRAAALESVVAVIRALQAAVNDGQDTGMLVLAMGTSAASSGVDEKTAALAAERAADYRLLRDTFGVRGEAVLAGVTASTSSRSGRLVVTPRRVVYFASLLGFAFKLDIPATHLFGARVGDGGVMSASPLVLTYFDAAKAEADSEKQLAAGASSAVPLDALPAATRAAFLSLPQPWRDRVVSLGGPQYLTELSLALGGAAPPPAASLALLLALTRQATTEADGPRVLAPSDAERIRVAAANASAAAEAEARRARLAAQAGGGEAAEPTTPAVDDFLGAGSAAADAFADVAGAGAAALHRRMGVSDDPDDPFAGLGAAFLWNQANRPMAAADAGQFRVFADAAAMAGPLGAYVAAKAAEAISARGKFVVAVSGGSLPKNLAAALVAAKGAEGLADASAWTIVYADERVVPLDDPDSNHKAVLDTLTGAGAPLEGATTVPIDPSSTSAAQCAERYEAELRRITGSAAPAVPVLDLVLLGMGPDGHTASLFPGHALLSEAAAAVAAIEDSPKPPPRRVTLTLPVLRAARASAFVCTGGSKAEAFASVHATLKGGASDPDSLPSARVPDATWFLDAPAAGSTLAV